ncbi:hypothetical protein ABIA39_002031 [Nocardia sp. GAS34]
MSIFTKEGEGKWVIRDKADNWNGSTADYTPDGQKGIELKTRLGDDGN